MDLIKKRTYIEKRAAYVKKLSDNYQTSLFFTNFRNEIKITKKNWKKILPYKTILIVTICLN